MLSSPWVAVSHVRLEIRNEAGSWTGTGGPILEMGPAPPEQPVPDGAPGPTRRLVNEGPTILEGRGEYEGYTAYIHFPPDTDAEADEAFADFGGGEPFEAVIVNRDTLGFPSDEVWLREMRRTGQAE